MSQDVLDRLQDDIIFNGRFCNSQVIRALAGKTDEYGESRQADVMLMGNGAATLAQCVPGSDDHVANGIAIGMELGKPTFGQIGEDFLKRKLPQYTNSGLGVALTKYMLHGLLIDRAKQIIAGVKRMLDGEAPQTNEERAAGLAIDLYMITHKVESKEDIYYVSLLSIARTAMETGDFSPLFESNLYPRLKNMDPEKPLIRRTEQDKQALEDAFDYYMANFSLIDKDFLWALEGYSEVEIVAYYVMSLSERALQNFQK